MSQLIRGLPVSMWSDEDIREALNIIVSTPAYGPQLALVAEMAVRAFDRAKVAKAEGDDRG